MEKLLPVAKAKMEPFVSEVQEHVKPLGHAAAYLGSCCVWILLVPFVMISAGFKHLTLKFKPKSDV